MNHTSLTVPNFAGLSFVVFLTGLATVGFGAVDMMMIAPEGTTHIAAVGQGDLVYTAMASFFLGVVGVFGSRFAIAEGQGRTGERMSVLLTGFALVVVVYQLVAVLAGLVVGSVLDAAHQPPEVVPLVSGYVQVRCAGVAGAIVYTCVAEALKIFGRARYALVLLVNGFILNGLLDWMFLRGWLRPVFTSPERAVAAATVATHLVMAVAGCLVFARAMRVRGHRFAVPGFQETRAEFASAMRIAPGVGMRHLNDYVGSVVPILFIGTLGAGALAAASIAAKIYTVFCRVPQACVSASFILYGYALGRSDRLTPVRKRLLGYSALPTGFACLLAIVCTGPIVGLFSGAGTDERLAGMLFFAFLIPLPAYLIQAVFGEMLTAHQRGGLLSVASMAATYLLTIPLAWCAVFVVGSAFLAVLAVGAATTFLAVLFSIALGRQATTVSEVNLVQG